MVIRSDIGSSQQVQDTTIILHRITPSTQVDSKEGQEAVPCLLPTILSRYFNHTVEDLTYMLVVEDDVRCKGVCPFLCTAWNANSEPGL